MVCHGLIVVMFSTAVERWHGAIECLFDEATKRRAMALAFPCWSFGMALHCEALRCLALVFMRLHELCALPRS